MPASPLDSEIRTYVESVARPRLEAPSGAILSYLRPHLEAYYASNMAIEASVLDKELTLNGLRFHYRDWGNETAQALIDRMMDLG